MKEIIIDGNRLYNIDGFYEEKMFVAECAEVKDNLIEIGVRAYRDVYIGDKLIIKESELDDSVSDNFTVESIITYRISMDFLNKGMTGYLYLSGKDNIGKMLKSSFYLGEPCFEIRRKTCLDSLRKKFIELPQDIIQLVTECCDVRFFEKYMQYNYKIHSIDEFRTWICG